MSKAMVAMYRAQFLVTADAVTVALKKARLYKDWLTSLHSSPSYHSAEHIPIFIARLPPERVPQEVAEAVAAYFEAGKQYEAVRNKENGNE